MPGLIFNVNDFVLMLRIDIITIDLKMETTLKISIYWILDEIHHNCRSAASILLYIQVSKILNISDIKCN